MAKIESVSGSNGKRYVFYDEIKAQGGIKDVYFSPAPEYVVAFYREQPDPVGRKRLEKLVTAYRDGILLQSGGDYWQKVYCWPETIVEHNGRIGLVVPRYDKSFFFAKGSFNNDSLGIKGKEKQGKWFTTHTHRGHYLAADERGDWLRFLQISLDLARGVRRLHAAGLAHSDLSYKNVLVDPVNESRGRACIIDIDGLVVPGIFPPDVAGTPDFIAPEVIATMHLDRKDPKRALPKRETDLHALAVLVYLYMLRRHPLRGGKCHDQDSEKDERAMMGPGALFIEHPHDSSNRVREWKPKDAPWANPGAMPCKLTGPYLKALFERSFVEGLHDPAKRPSAQEYELALVRTADLLQPCANTKCDMRWYPFDNSSAPKCPSCGEPYRGLLPVLNLYSRRGSQPFRPENHRIMVWNGQRLYPWHARRDKSSNEHTKPEDKRPVAYFQLHEGRWWMVNEQLLRLFELSGGSGGSGEPPQKRHIPPTQRIELKDGGQFLLDDHEDGRLVSVQLVRGA
jgi:serine/threonine protein kinase